MHALTPPGGFANVPPMRLADLYRSHVATLTASTTEALEATGFDAIAIHSGAAVLRSPFDDQHYPLEVVPELEHWAAVGLPDCVLHLAKGAAPKLYRVRADSFWERPSEPDWALIRAGLEVEELASMDEVRRRLGDRKTACISHGLGLPHDNPPELIALLHARRTTKTEYEVECMAEASRVAARGHLAVERMFRAGLRSELGLHLEYLRVTGQDDAETPYKNIVALGEAAAILHHVHLRDAPDAPSLLVDAGAQHRGYASDITRTYAAAPGLFAELIAGMSALQTALLASIRVGREFEDLHDESHVRLGGLLADTGLVHSSAEAAVATGITRKLYPHGLGHSLGIQVHDVGMKERAPRSDNPWLRNTSTIAAGQVFTIEPGLYFIDSLLAELRAGPHAADVNWKMVDALRPFGGIRIEDNVLVKPDGIRNLTREAFDAA